MPLFYTVSCKRSMPGQGNLPAENLSPKVKMLGLNCSDLSNGKNNTEINRTADCFSQTVPDGQHVCIGNYPKTLLFCVLFADC